MGETPQGCALNSHSSLTCSWALGDSIPAVTGLPGATDRWAPNQVGAGFGVGLTQGHVAEHCPPWGAAT